MDKFMRDVTAYIPQLRGYAASLTGSLADADDLVQEMLLRVCRHRSQFQEGTNLRAWLHTILRNVFYSRLRRERSMVQDVEGRHAAQLGQAPDQEWRLRFGELLQALDKITPEQREALILVVVSGLSYEEAAEVCGCAVGTIKSRINRARDRLATLLDIADSRSHGGRAGWADHRPTAYL
ncbi:sigma-70 family RNA polymerase sigma factor [Caulobacter segnis]|uniref:sigma-70 family RNA polymerase sigma factor n=1 Tax=Caulobacter segnis TaxID=88688 RepID=UPI00240F0607|nr:sigma-70 family RNA polymerase sigma factor [Caulobacter segnis]MDG2520356.1 sigma-70 family RNA polymerase sigma factor [Caulobacter segnis]